MSFSVGATGITEQYGEVVVEFATALRTRGLSSSQIWELLIQSPTCSVSFPAGAEESAPVLTLAALRDGCYTRVPTTAPFRLMLLEGTAVLSSYSRPVLDLTSDLFEDTSILLTPSRSVFIGASTIYSLLARSNALELRIHAPHPLPDWPLGHCLPTSTLKAMDYISGVISGVFKNFIDGSFAHALHKRTSCIQIAPALMAAPVMPNLRLSSPTLPRRPMLRFGAPCISEYGAQQEACRREFFDRLQRWDEEIQEREPKRISADDVSRGECVGELLVKMIASGLHLYDIAKESATGSSSVDMVVNTLRDGTTSMLMYRCTIFDGKNMFLRLHLFPNASESYIHTHSGNIVTVCLNGAYTHNIWHVVPSTTDIVHVCKRGVDGVQSVEDSISGRLCKKMQFAHAAPHAYFIDRQTYHTVDVRPEDLREGRKTLTAFCRDKVELSTTSILRDSSVDDASDTIVKSTDFRLDVLESIKVLEQMELLIMQSHEGLQYEGTFARPA
jgi:hypothetical protein